MPATATTYLLAAYLLLVLLDGAAGFRLFRASVRAGAGLYCRATRQASWERERCTDRVFHSRAVWVVISLGMGALTYRVANDLLTAS